MELTLHVCYIQIIVLLSTGFSLSITVGNFDDDRQAVNMNSFFFLTFFDYSEIGFATFVIDN